MRRSDIARGYPQAPLSRAEIDAKFDELVGTVAGPERLSQLRAAARGIAAAENVTALAGVLSQPAQSIGDARHRQ